MDGSAGPCAWQGYVAKWCAICIFLFLRFYNFIKGFVHIYIISLKELQLLFLYLTYELAQTFITFNRTDVSLFKQTNK